MKKQRYGSQPCRFKCPVCGGRGWVRKTVVMNEWPYRCRMCRGIGVVTRARLVALLASPSAKWHKQEQWRNRLRRLERGGLSPRTWRIVWSAMVKHIPEVFDVLDRVQEESPVHAAEVRGVEPQRSSARGHQADLWRDGDASQAHG